MSRPRPTAYDKAGELLARRPYFRAELAARLARAGYEEDEIAGALARLARVGYLDDEALAAAEAERLRERKGLGRARIAADLSRRGAPRSIASEVASESPEEELARARAEAERWSATSRKPQPAALARFLERKGFSPRTIVAVLEDFGDGEAVEPGGPEDG